MHQTQHQRSPLQQTQQQESHCWQEESVVLPNPENGYAVHQLPPQQEHVDLGAGILVESVTTTAGQESATPEINDHKVTKTILTAAALVVYDDKTARGSTSEGLDIVIEVATRDLGSSQCLNPEIPPSLKAVLNNTEVNMGCKSVPTMVVSDLRERGSKVKQPDDASIGRLAWLVPSLLPAISTHMMLVKTSLLGFSSLKLEGYLENLKISTVAQRSPAPTRARWRPGTMQTSSR